MQVDPEYLRQHYASLSDEGLLEIDRADLVPTAQKIFDLEVAHRKLVRPRDMRQAQRTDLRRDEVDVEPGNLDEEPAGESLTPEDEPDWLEDAAEAYSFACTRGTDPAPDAAHARDVLVAAEIPCYLDLCEEPAAEITSPGPTHRWRLMVPGNLTFRAASVLECEISNPEFEAGWKTHLEALSDDELREMTPEVAFCGLFDRIERVNRVYDEEIARRRLK
jgi:hypothetical protein